MAALCSTAIGLDAMFGGAGPCSDGRCTRLPGNDAYVGGIDAQELRQIGTRDIHGLLRLDHLGSCGGEFGLGARLIGAGTQLGVHLRVIVRRRTSARSTPACAARTVS